MKQILLIFAFSLSVFSWTTTNDTLQARKLFKGDTADMRIDSIATRTTKITGCPLASVMSDSVLVLRSGVISHISKDSIHDTVGHGSRPIGNGTANTFTIWTGTNTIGNSAYATELDGIQIARTSGSLSFVISRGANRLADLGSGSGSSGLYGIMRLYHGSQDTPNVQFYANSSGYNSWIATGNNAGNVGIGTVDPISKLQIIGRQTAECDSADTGIFIILKVSGKTFLARDSSDTCITNYLKVGSSSHYSFWDGVSIWGTTVIDALNQPFTLGASKVTIGTGDSGICFSTPPKGASAYYTNQFSVSKFYEQGKLANGNTIEIVRSSAIDNLVNHFIEGSGKIWVSAVSNEVTSFCEFIYGRGSDSTGYVYILHEYGSIDFVNTDTDTKICILIDAVFDSDATLYIKNRTGITRGLKYDVSAMTDY